MFWIMDKLFAGKSDTTVRVTCLGAALLLIAVAVALKVAL